MNRLLLVLLGLLLCAPLSGCPSTTPPDDDDATGDDDDATGDDDDATGDDDDATGDDDDATGDDDDATGDDDDATGDDDDATGDDDDATGDDDDATGDDDDSTEPPVDNDGDGVDATTDCDDNDAANYPGNTEVCDGQDNDCVGGADFDAAGEVDADADASLSCEDCDDADAANYPGNTEVCDLADNDCDATTFAAGEDTDADSDGSVTCLDCDDADAANFPGNTEICDLADNDCDATTFAAGEDTDADSDGSVTCLDCDDADGANYPGNTEVCDDADNDCDATTFAAGEDTDVDGDGSVTCLDCDDGDAANFPGNTEVCDGQDNDCLGGANADALGEVDGDLDLVLSCDDCDDGDAANYPGNTEVCDGQDNDCNSVADFDLAGEVDADSDGSISCEDCDDSDGTLTPGAVELCDGLDNNCDAAVAEVWVASLGTNGFNGPDRLRGVEFVPSTDALLSSFSTVLTAPVGTELTFALYEGPVGGPSAVVASNVVTVPASLAGAANEVSSGGIGYSMSAGSLYSLVVHWTANVGYSTDSVITPDPAWGVFQRAIGVDTVTSLPADLSGALTATGQYSFSIVTDDEVDGDSDLSLACADCDDGDGNNAPGNVEVCDGFDNDCNWLADADVDGEIDFDTDLSLSCDDCDDTDPTAYPGNTELCDGIDNDCDATTEAGDGETDDDVDGFINCEDCEDLDTTAFPGATEICDGLDTNCDGAVAATYSILGGTNISGVSRYRGNRFEVTQSTLLTAFSLELDAAAGREIVFAVYEAATASGAYTLIASNQVEVPAALAGSFNEIWSGAFGIELEAGSFYALVAWWDADSSVGYRQPSSSLATTTSFGDHLGSLWGDALTLPTSPASPNTSGVYAGSVLTDDEGDFDLDLSIACEDCDDTEALAFPGNPELCDGFDNNCSGTIDDFAPVVSDAPGTAISASGSTGVYPETIDVPAAGPIVDLNVSLDITHTFTGDLDITLISPLGTSINLTSDNGGSGDNYTGTTFDDEATSSVVGSSAPFTGSFIPEDALSTFDGEASGGTWTLQVADDANGDGGTINSWSLSFITDPGADVGAFASCAAESCDAILTADPASVDGVYWLDPTGGDPFEAYCDQTTSGGGWTLLLKTSGDSTFGFNDPLWENTTLLNEADPDLDTTVNSKYQAYNDLEVSELSGCFPAQGPTGVCIGIALGLGPITALDRFSLGAGQAGTGLTNQFYTGWSVQPNCQWYGINSPYEYQAVRFGFTANQENDCNTNDTAIGFGVGPQTPSSAQTSYGSGEKCVSSQCSLGNVDQGFPGLLWGR